jgi:acetyl-CoA carboxylase biotin carboxyl carrier protein
LDIEQIKELMANVESSKIKKFVLKQGDFELQLEKEGDHLPASALPPHFHSPRSAFSPESPAEPIFHSDSKGKTMTRAETAVDGKFVTSPMVGTFFSSPAPDQPAFVKVGDRIEENTVVCIIEAMKVMNEVKANVSGTVVEILVENSNPVEFGSKIFRIT